LISHYLVLRLKLIYRELGQYALPISIAFLALSIFLTYVFLTTENMDDNKLIIISATPAILLFLYHTNRQDIKMLSALFGKSKRRTILYTEYLFLISPLAAIIATKQPLYAVALLFYTVIIPLIPQHFTLGKLNFSPFGKGNFEWNSGFRMMGIAQILLFIFFIISCAIQLNFNLSLFLLGTTLVFFTFNYSTPEGEQFIIKYRDPAEMIQAKMKFSVLNLSVIGLALCLVQMLFYQKFSWFFPMIVIQLIVICVNQMLLKYAYYPVKSASELNQTILFFIGLIPFLTPFLILLNFHFYKKAKRKLAHYFTL